MLSLIKVSESEKLPPVDSEEVKILRGLFYVHLYGALEQSLNEAIESFLQSIEDLQKKTKDLDLSFFPTAMHTQFIALADMQSKKKWQRRLDFIDAMSNDKVCRIESAIFASHLQSADFKTLCEVASYMGINLQETNARQDRLYIDEVVNKRHQVAHGRTSPSIVGGSGRSDDLKIRFDAVVRVVELFMQILERHFNNSGFLREQT